MNTPKRLRHDIPYWVNRNAAVYHIRIRIDRASRIDLTSPTVARPILDSVNYYNALGKWWADLFLLMPDHVHALLRFNPEQSFPEIVGAWKKWHCTHNHISWQENFFDHRIRSEESLREKLRYIQNNPIRAGLVGDFHDWPWWTSSKCENKHPKRQ